jgi:iron complex outermembrane receptor protein
MIRVTEAISGDIPEFLSTQLEWEVGLTYSKTNDVKQAQDMLVDRFQGALNGFGGANCTGSTPGANGCQYFNPFSSAIEQNVFTGATNPYYQAGLANDPNLLAWMYVPVEFERIYENYVVDPILRGNLGIELPGGPIALAVGGQFRMQTEEVRLDQYSDRSYNPCPTLGVTNCATSAQVGALVYNRSGNVFGAAASNYRPEFRKYPVWAAFLETKLPILSTLDLSLSGRFEKFISDVTDKDNEVFVPAAGIKWQPMDWLGARASWGKTFSQVNPPRDRDPIVAGSLASAKYTGLGGGGAPYATYNYANTDVKPEKGDYLDLGLLFDVGNFRGTVDYYSMEINDYTRTMAVANVLDGLAMPGSPAGPANLTPVNCSSPVLSQPQSSMGGRPLVELPGACNQGLTMMSDLVNGRVNYFAGNGQTNSGKLTTSGIDLSASYRFDNVLGGSITPSLDYSRILEWKLGDFAIGGVKLADGYDGLGYVNLSSGRTGVSVAEWRGSFGVAYRREGHTINLQIQYVPSIINEDATNYTSSVGRNANIGDANGIVPAGAACPTGELTSDLGNVPAGAGTGQFGTTAASGIRGYCAGQNTAPQSGHKVEEWVNVDLIYRLQLPAETGLTVTINNLLNTDPSYFRGIVPYNTAYGSPLGRTVKVGVSKRF